MKSYNLIFFDYRTHPKPSFNHFRSTSVPACLKDVVVQRFAEIRPELPGLYEAHEIDAIYLDAIGPVYGGGDVVVEAPSGYRVECPVSHADVVADYLRDLTKREREHSFALYHTMFNLAALPWDDLEFLAAEFAEKAQAAVTQRTLARSAFGPNIVRVDTPSGSR